HGERNAESVTTRPQLARVFAIVHQVQAEYDFRQCVLTSVVDDILSEALLADQESEKVDFKESLDDSSKGEWCEIIKDIVAMANSGGSVILIGVNDDGSISNANVSPVLNYDPADLTNKMFSYTGHHFSAFKITPVQKSGITIAAIQIGLI